MTSRAVVSPLAAPRRQQRGENVADVDIAAGVALGGRVNAVEVGV